MDLSDPTRALTPTLDGPVLSTLAASGRALTVGEVAAQTARGSEIGIRRSLTRLVDQGLVRATLVGRNRVHELNRDHLAAPAAEVLSGLWLELWRRLREALAGWCPSPVYACGFGSAARRDGDPSSDIDLLLIHPPFLSDEKPRDVSRGVLASITQLGTEIALAVGATGPADPDRWHDQVDQIRGQVQRWTGNPLQVVDLSIYEWREPNASLQPLVAEIRLDAIDLIGSKALVPVRNQAQTDA